MELAAQGILFDMDGILVSSLGSVERSWAKWGDMRGVDGAKAIATAHGKRAIDTIRMLRPDLNDREELDLIEQIEIDDKDDIQVLPGIPELLRSLPKGSWTICTSATKRLAKVRLEHSGLLVPEQFISADMVEHGKPHPEPYLRGAALLGFDAARCVVFEDAPAGCEAGKAAGCTVIATLFSHTDEQLACADYRVHTLEHVRVTGTAGALTIRFEPV
ncbi:HAD-IA family hydrolase [Acidipila sp. EB88]|uniref:HAD-IA family hydrolase n=1 Tax=Acidipila sp. EB88 TaxID=2305226 RepID=UPI000F5D810A|nr:HAD-IA family hydrolase [Acidipila sp. EB88]RRA50147.1 HAD family hydrolase [Acidipila sp. EB88]